jgi:uncharacterized protein (DUF983 family)
MCVKLISVRFVICENHVAPPWRQKKERTAETKIYIYNSLVLVSKKNISLFPLFHFLSDMSTSSGANERNGCGDLSNSDPQKTFEADLSAFVYALESLSLKSPVSIDDGNEDPYEPPYFQHIVDGIADDAQPVQTERLTEAKTLLNSSDTTITTTTTGLESNSGFDALALGLVSSEFNCTFGRLPETKEEISHPSRCLYTRVVCPFAHVGCNVVVMRLQLEVHLSDNLPVHMALTTRALNQAKNAVIELVVEKWSQLSVGRVVESESCSSCGSNYRLCARRDGDSFFSLSVKGDRAASVNLKFLVKKANGSGSEKVGEVNKVYGSNGGMSDFGHAQLSSACYDETNDRVTFGAVIKTQ